MSIHTPGGPAFPPPNGIHDGMTLRDYFAAAALGWIAQECEAWNMRQPEKDQLLTREIARVAAGRAYMYADAMLAARERD